MLSKLRDFFLSLGSKDFEQDHNEAILTLLAWVMYADGKIEPSEQSKLKEFLDAVEWKSETPAKQFLAATAQRVKNVAPNSPEEADLVKELTGKLRGEDIRYKALKVCHELAKADNYFDQAEKHLLKLFSKALLK